MSFFSFILFSCADLEYLHFWWFLLCNGIFILVLYVRYSSSKIIHINIIYNNNYIHINIMNSTNTFVWDYKITFLLISLLYRCCFIFLHTVSADMFSTLLQVNCLFYRLCLKYLLVTCDCSIFLARSLLRFFHLFAAKSPIHSVWYFLSICVNLS